jgi:hypothetical protein
MLSAMTTARLRIKRGDEHRDAGNLMRVIWPSIWACGGGGGADDQKLGNRWLDADAWFPGAICRLDHPAWMC